MPVRAGSVAKNVVVFGDMGVHRVGGVSQVRISLFADDEMFSWQERLVHERELFSRSARGSDARGHRSVPSEYIWQHIAEDPELTKGQGDRCGQVDELVARLLASVCSCAGRRYRALMRIHKQSPDIAGGVHVGKDDLDVGGGDCGILAVTQVVRLARPRLGA